MEGHTPLTFWILDENVQHYILMVSNYFGYQELDPITGIPNEETRGAYAKRKIAGTIKGVIDQQALKEMSDDIVVPPIDIVVE